MSESITIIPNPNWFAEFQLESQPNDFLLRQAGGLKAATLRNEPIVTGEVQALQAEYSSVAHGDPGEARFYPRALWSILEFGSVNNPPYSPIRRAASSLGLKLELTGG